VKWTRDQRQLFLALTIVNGAADGTTFVVNLPTGRALPDFPREGIGTEAELRKLPNIRVINRIGLFPGPTSSIYAFQRQSVQRNLYRIAVPQ
jgi:hypothetical protein